MKCLECGYDNSKDSIYCARCGYKPEINGLEKILFAVGIMGFIFVIIEALLIIAAYATAM